jgi:CheY-like chemotaxis protein
MLKRFFKADKHMSDYIILVVEDDQAVRQTLVDILEEEGYKVWSAMDGEQALKLLDRMGMPHAIIIDLMMPNMNGLEFVERARVRYGHHSFPPSLLLTAARQGEATANGMEVADYLPKPFEHDDLLHHVWHLVDKKQYAKRA